MIKINGVDLPATPSTFQVTVLDLDDGEASKRTADGTLHRDRIATKRKIDMTWGPLNWADTSQILQAVQNEFFQCTYPDPMTGRMETKTFYVGDRVAPFAVSRGNEIYWTGLKLTLTER